MKVLPSDRAEIMYFVRKQYSDATGGDSLGTLRIRAEGVSEGDVLVGFYKRHFLDAAQTPAKAKQDFFAYIQWAVGSWRDWDARTRANFFGTLSSKKMLERYLSV